MSFIQMSTVDVDGAAILENQYIFIKHRDNRYNILDIEKGVMLLMKSLKFNLGTFCLYLFYEHVLH